MISVQWKTFEEENFHEFHGLETLNKIFPYEIMGAEHANIQCEY